MTKLLLPILMSFALIGCSVRGVDTTLVPQLYENGQLVYVYSDLANFAQPDADQDAEKNRLRDLTDWVTDAAICPSGYEILQRKAIAVRAWSQGRRVYYFIKCKG